MEQKSKKNINHTALDCQLSIYQIVTIYFAVENFGKK